MIGLGHILVKLLSLAEAVRDEEGVSDVEGVKEGAREGAREGFREGAREEGVLWLFINSSTSRW